MSKYALYIFEGGELEEVISGLKNIKKFVDKEYAKKYESNTERSSKKIPRNSRKT